MFSNCVYYRKQRVATMAVIVAVDVADGVVDDDGWRWVTMRDDA